jgi:hypothetical protein
VIGSGLPTPFDERVVSLDDLFREHRGVGVGGFRVQVTILVVLVRSASLLRVFAVGEASHGTKRGCRNRN